MTHKRIRVKGGRGHYRNEYKLSLRIEGPPDSDEWKNAEQNEQRGSEEKGEQGAAAGLGHSVKENQSGMTGEPGQSQGMEILTSHPRKKKHKN